jgi:hypothetical protein
VKHAVMVCCYCPTRFGRAEILKTRLRRYMDDERCVNFCALAFRLEAVTIVV